MQRSEDPDVRLSAGFLDVWSPYVMMQTSHFQLFLKHLAFSTPTV